MMRAGTGEVDLSVRAAMAPWTRLLALESLGRWFLRGATLALFAASLVLAVGWLLPVPMSDLQPLALRVGAPFLLIALLVGAWPRSTLHRASELDVRLNF